jgi:hypothetical protein
MSRTGRKSVRAQAIDVSQYTAGVLVVRVHSGTVAGTASVAIAAKITQPTPEDPARDFVVAAAVATATVATGVAPTVARVSLGTDFGSMLQISATHNANSGASFSLDLSAELVMKV